MSDSFLVYFSLKDIAAHTGFLYPAVRAWFLAGRLDGPEDNIQIGEDIRIPWPNIKRFLEHHNVRLLPRRAVASRDYEVRMVKSGIKARNAGELRRKLAAEKAREKLAAEELQKQTLDDHTNV